jgi:hypothetical protein
MKVTVEGQFVEILPTGKSDEPKNYKQPFPLIGHTSFSFTDTEVFIHELYSGTSESCLFADFEGDAPYTTPQAIKDYLMSILV